MSVDGLIEYVNMYGESPDDSIYRIDVESKELEKNLSALKALCEDNSYWRDSKESTDVRIYYELRFNNEVLLKVSLWSVDLQFSHNGIKCRCIVINDTGIETKSNAYYDIIMPFLREDDRAADVVYGSRYARGEIYEDAE